MQNQICVMFFISRVKTSAFSMYASNKKRRSRFLLALPVSLQQLCIPHASYADCTMWARPLKCADPYFTVSMAMCVYLSRSAPRPTNDETHPLQGASHRQQPRRRAIIESAKSAPLSRCEVHTQQEELVARVRPPALIDADLTVMQREPNEGLRCEMILSRFVMQRVAHCSNMRESSR